MRWESDVILRWAQKPEMKLGKSIGLKEVMLLKSEDQIQCVSEHSLVRKRSSQSIKSIIPLIFDLRTVFD